ncbi:MAG: AAA family ATPase [Alphaproteobacteria bacterium]|jgi:predicted kinase
MNEKILYIVRGVPGSGKSTYAKSLMAGKMSASHWETDMWFMEEVECEDDCVEEVYKFDPTKLADYHRECQRAVCCDMQDGVETIVVSNTFIRKWEADMYYMLAKLWGYRVVVHRMNNSYDNVHGVPQDKVDIMRCYMEHYPDEIWIGGDNGVL